MCSLRQRSGPFLLTFALGLRSTRSLRLSKCPSYMSHRASGSSVTCCTVHMPPVPFSSNKPTMTKDNFTKFLNEKQRDSRLNEELYPRLRQDQIKALIDKYEPLTANSNRGLCYQMCKIVIQNTV